ncbi:MAG: toprim domain-containing protein [Acholeplasmatales bacterium]|nr:toprim domain-containing protein [Acholeplasmatales bacterium]
MHIKIRNKLIVTPIETILRQAQKELNNGKLKDIEIKPNAKNCNITCPIHKDGMETNASCQILVDTNDKELEAGWAHCFTCGYSGSLATTINALFDELDPRFGEDWLIERFGNIYVDTKEYLPPFEITEEPKQFLNEEDLKQYDFYHPYMWKRKLSKEVVDQFRVGYDRLRSAITFPVYDEKHRLVMVTARSVNSKRFYIPEGVEKPVYLLYDIIERGVTSVVVCESQLNTLYARSLGYDSVGLFGTGSRSQLQTLNKSGIRNYILAFDGDEAGHKGAERFKKYINKHCFITELQLPKGKDLNDLSPEEVHDLIKNQKSTIF